MTVCTAITDGTNTWIASDRRRCWGNDYLDTGEPKWSMVGSFWVGCSGGGRVEDILRGLIHDDGLWHGDPYILCDELRRRFIEGKMPEDKPGRWDSTFILVRPGTVALIDSGFSLTLWPKNRLLAIGSGRDVAWGVWWAMSAASDIEAVLRLGIEAATANDCSCGGEPWVRRI